MLTYIFEAYHALVWGKWDTTTLGRQANVSHDDRTERLVSWRMSIAGTSLTRRWRDAATRREPVEPLLQCLVLQRQGNVGKRRSWFCGPERR